MEYIDAILWYASWPVIVWIAYRFVLLNCNHHRKMERLEELEAFYIKEHGSLDGLSSTCCSNEVKLENE